jgi:HD superfamily phosphohydrolase YqeK
LHAAATVRDECGLTDAEGAEEIAEAVRLHSTSDAGAGLLARVLFLADRLEPTRSFEGARELRLLARKDFEAAYRRALEAKIRHLETEGRAVSPRARRALSAVGDAR